MKIVSILVGDDNVHRHYFVYEGYSIRVEEKYNFVHQKYSFVGYNTSSEYKYVCVENNKQT